MISPLGGVTPTKPGSASLPFFGIEPAIIDPVSGEEIHGNDVEGVLAIKKPWPSMARTVWGAHKRYMDTYLNVYRGYYVSQPWSSSLLFQLTCRSSPVTALAEIMKATIGSEVVWTMLSTFPGTDCQQRRSRQLSSSIVSEYACLAPRHQLTLGRPSCRGGSRGH